jgi:hypothetical protein
LPGHSVSNVFGVVSPEFVNSVSPRTNIEVLRHEPGARFDAWIFQGGHESGKWYSVFAGRQIAAEAPLFGRSNALVLHEADWSTLDQTVLPLSASARQFVYGMGLVDQVNVGYLADEERAQYRQFTRTPGVKLLPVSETLQLEGRLITEVGRVVMGSETLRIRSEPGREMRFVLRTSRAAGLPLPGGLERIEFASPISLSLQVNGRDADSPIVNLNASHEFTEIGARISGEMITGDSIELTVGGDHIAYAYWFYQ